ncbi:MAG: hypothetical protein COA62_15785 [Rhodobiaceae bacterium]|nr:MAG: hypothetical protein COA62_15785 [Rhodobiaceae bacterium]
MSKFNFNDAEKQNDDSGYQEDSVSLSEIKQMLRDEITTLVDYLFVGQKIHSRDRNGVRYGTRGSMQINTAGPGRGSFISHETGEGGSALDLISHVNGTNFSGAVRWARDWLGIDAGHARVKHKSAEEIAEIKRKDKEEQARLRAEAIARGVAFYAAAKVHSASAWNGGGRGASYFKFRRLRPLSGDDGVIMGFDKLGYCLVFPASNAAGEITGVQRIYLNERGSKARVGSGGVSKLSLGDMRGSAWLSNTESTPLFQNVVAITEGPEDAITVSQCVSIPCYAAFGIANIAHAPIPPGSLVLVVRDNDAPGSESIRTMDRAVIELQDRGYKVAQVRPTQGYKDVNELLQLEGPAAVRAMFAPVFDPESEDLGVHKGMDPEVINAGSGADLAIHLGESLTDFMSQTKEWLDWNRLWHDVEGGPPEPITPKVQIVAAAGGGKTTRTSMHLISDQVITKKADSPRTDIIVPTKKTQQQFAYALATEFAKAGIRHDIVVIDGRSVENCFRLEEVKAAASGAEEGAGILADFAAKEEAFSRAACKKVVMVQNDDGWPVPEDIKCPHYDGCPYIKQFERLQPEGAVGVFTHPYLMIPPVYGERKASVVVVDEQTLNVGLKTRSIPVKSFLNEKRYYTAVQLLPEGLSARDREDLLDGCYDAKEHEAMTKRVVHAIKSGVGALRLMREDNITIEALVKLRETERKAIARTHDLSPDMTTAELSQKIKDMPKNAMHDAWRLWDAVIREYGVKRDNLMAVHYIPNHDSNGLRVAEHIQFHYKDEYVRTRGAATLVLDADGTPTLGRAIYGPGMVTHTINAARVARVYQCTKTEAGNKYLLGEGEKTDSEDRKIAQQKAGLSARRRIESLSKEIQVRHADDGDGENTGDVVVMMPKKVRDKIAVETDGPGDGIEHNHFGNVRGNNEYETFKSVLIVGRNQPRVDDIVATTKALFCRDELLVSRVHDWVEQKLKSKDGQERVVKPMTMTDPRCQAVLEMSREKELLQAIDRLRLIHRRADNPGNVYIVSNLILPGLGVDEFFDWRQGDHGNMKRDALGAHAAQSIFDHNDGVMPLSPSVLGACLPPELSGVGNENGGVNQPRKPRPVWSKSGVAEFAKKYRKRLNTAKKSGVGKQYIIYIRKGSLSGEENYFQISWKGRGGELTAVAVGPTEGEAVCRVRAMLNRAGLNVPEDFSARSTDRLVI